MSPYYSLIESCATGGPMIRSGIGVPAAIWGTWRDFEFSAPTDTQIARLALWREAYGQGTASGGNWRMRAIVDRDTPLGGSFGPDQCKTGEPYHPDDMQGRRRPRTATRRASRYDLAATRLRLGLECFAPLVRSCDTGGRGSPLGYYRLKAAIVTIRDETLPALDAGGPLFESGWRRADSDLADQRHRQHRHQERPTAGRRAGAQPASISGCDYTFPRPCSDTGSRRLGLGSGADRRRLAAGAGRRGGRRRQPDVGDADGHHRRARARGDVDAGQRADHQRARR